MRIYVASSWRNLLQPYIVVMLRKCGHEVYDFRSPTPGDSGFSWREIHPDWENWTPQQYRDALEHPIAKEGFKNDINVLLVKNGLSIKTGSLRYGESVVGIRNDFE